MPIIYYRAPSDEIFKEVKIAAVELWKEVDTDNDKYGYSSEKIKRIKDLKNIQDNMMYMVAMFDDDNQRLLAERLSPETRAAIRERLESGGLPEEFNHF